MTCPDCQGKGYTVERSLDPDRVQRYTCSTCQGDGVVPDGDEAA